MMWIGTGVKLPDGPWAGHKFDIVTLKGIKTTSHVGDDPERVLEGRTDVSEIVAEDVGRLRWCVRQCVKTSGMGMTFERDPEMWKGLAKRREDSLELPGAIRKPARITGRSKHVPKKHPRYPQ
jgi:hypothetical protein